MESVFNWSVILSTVGMLTSIIVLVLKKLTWGKLQDCSGSIG